MQVFVNFLRLLKAGETVYQTLFVTKRAFFTLNNLSDRVSDIFVRIEKFNSVSDTCCPAFRDSGYASEVPGDAIRIRNTAWGIIHMGEVKIQSRDDVRDAYRRAMGAPTFSLDDISERVIDASLAEFPPPR